MPGESKPLRWTKTPPSKPGWYWWRERGVSPARVVRVVDYEIRNMAEHPELYVPSEWSSAPIAEPEEAT